MPKTSRYDLPPIGASVPELERVSRDTIQGYLNVAGEVTLVAGTTSTILEDSLFTTTTEVLLIPRDAAGAAISWWLQQRMAGRIIMGHDAPGSDILFGYIAIG
jgi:hypothetical protein